MEFPFARHVSERGRGHPDGFRFSKLNWRANALRWRIDYCQPTPLSVRSLRRCRGPEFRSSDACTARGPDSGGMAPASHGRGPAVAHCSCPGVADLTALFIFTMSNSPSRSRDAVRPGFETSFATRRGVAERRETRGAMTRHPGVLVTRHARRLRGALRPSAEGRAPLGAPPWRFSAGARASISGISSGSVQRAPRGQVVVPGGRGPGPPGADGYEPSPRDATPRSANGTVSGDAPR